jgi:hypothetical protein
MILDERTEFFDNTACQNEAGTDLIGDVIDLTLARDVGQGQPVYLMVSIDTAADGGAGAGATVAFQLASDSVAAIATDATQTIHFTSAAFTAAQLTAGAFFQFVVPAEGLAYERYLGVQTVTAVEGEDALVASAWLSLDPHGWQSYPDASN